MNGNEAGVLVYPNKVTYSPTATPPPQVTEYTTVNGLTQGLYLNFSFTQEVLSPPSDGDNLSDSTNTSDALSGGGLDDTPSVRRSVSFKERRKFEAETVTKRRNSDIDLQVGYPCVNMSRGVTTVTYVV